jgi:F-box-like
MKRIDELPDDVLLEIFGLYMKTYPPYGNKPEMEAWQSLVHVCRRWRSLVFRSPRCLNLRLFCSPKTPVRDTLDIWPALPLIIQGSVALMRPSGTDNIIAALGQSNRVCQVFLWGLTRITRWPLEEVLAAMQVPFPELTALQLFSNDKTSPVILDSFLGGSAPRMRLFELCGISFPGLPKLLLSATHLVHLTLYDTPHSGYISPEAIVALLSGLPSLRTLSLEFRSPQSRPDSERPSLPPPKRSILPALDEFRFRGVTEYIEELMTRIDTPRLDRMYITFFNQIDFDCPRLAQFINCTPKLRARDEAHVQFDDSAASVTLRYLTPESDSDDLLITIPCREPDWQLSSIEQVCNSMLPLSIVEDLYIDHGYYQLVWNDDAVEDTLWLELFLPFTGVKNLYLSKKFAPGIAVALQELVGGRITEVLPILQNIFVEALEPSEPFQENIGQFVAARQLSDHPIVIFVWIDDSYTEST